MTVAAVSSTLSNSTPIPQNNRPIAQFRQGFNQLGHDLSTGNLSAARQEFANLPKPDPSPTAHIPAPIEQAFSQLAQSLQSGNLAGANQAYGQIQHDIENRIAHRHNGGGHEPLPAQPGPTTSSASGTLSVKA